MKKLLAVGVIVLFLGVAIAPSINASDSQIDNLIKIRTTVSQFDGIDDNEILVSEREVDEIIAILEDLNLAIKNNDVESIKHYEEILKEKGILDKHHNVQFQNKIFEKINGLFKKARLPNSNTDDPYFPMSGIVLFTGHINKYRQDLSGVIAYWTFIMAIILYLITPFPINLIYFPLVLSILPFAVIQFIQWYRIFRFIIPFISCHTPDGNITAINFEGSASEKGRIHLVMNGFIGVQVQIWEDAETCYLFLSGLGQIKITPNNKLKS